MSNIAGRLEVLTDAGSPISSAQITDKVLLRENCINLLSKPSYIKTNKLF